MGAPAFHQDDSGKRRPSRSWLSLTGRSRSCAPAAWLWKKRGRVAVEASRSGDSACRKLERPQPFSREERSKSAPSQVGRSPIRVSPSAWAAGRQPARATRSMRRCKHRRPRRRRDPMRHLVLSREVAIARAKTAPIRDCPEEISCADDQRKQRGQNLTRRNVH